MFLLSKKLNVKKKILVINCLFENNYLDFLKQNAILTSQITSPCQIRLLK